MGYERTKYPGIFKYEGKAGVVYGIDFYAGGKRHREITGPRLTDARQELEKRRKSGRSGIYVSQADKRRRTFEDLAKEYEEKSGDGQYFKDTRRHYVETLKEFFKEKRLYEIDTLAIEDFKNKRKNTPTKHKRERSGIAVNRELETLRVMLNKAVLWGWIERSPFKRFVEERQKIFFEEGEARERILSETEIKKLFAVLDEIPKTKDESRQKGKPPYAYLKNIIVAALLTGLRRGDILKVKWDDIDLETKTLRFWEEKKDRWKTKPLCTSMIDLLKRIPREEGEFVFRGPDGQPVKDVKRAFRTVLKRAGIKDFRFHDVRRSSASFLLKMGSPLPVIQKHLGHTSLDMTQKYAHLSDQSERMELEKLGKLFPVGGFTGQKMGRSGDFEEMPIAGTA